MHALALPFLWSVTLCVQAQVYRSLDSDGGVTFSDRPTPNAIEMAVPLRAVTEYAGDNKARPSSDTADPGPYESFEIISPDDNHRSREPDGELQISMMISPPLMAGHQMVVEVDGIAAEGDLPNPAQLKLRGLALGTHTIRALLRDEEKAPVASTQTISVHILPPQLEAE